jgi:hypothetical protein
MLLQNNIDILFFILYEAEMTFLFTYNLYLSFLIFFKLKKIQYTGTLIPNIARIGTNYCEVSCVLGWFEISKHLIDYRFVPVDYLSFID